MDDLISRQMAIDTIRATSPELFSAYQHNIYVDKKEVMIRLMALPPAQRWIPVSEKLPEEYKKVLVTDAFGVYVGEFVDAEENWGGKHFINEHGMHSKSVVAWMPLPEPYKESDQYE